jgi:hypothetical protein
LLDLRWVQVLHGGMCVGIPWRHAPHESGSIHLLARARYPHMADELVRHPARSRAGLARVVRHTRRHGMAWGAARMLLHSAARVRRKAWSHASHHLQSCRLPT